MKAMKIRYIVLGLVLSTTLSINARTFTADEVIYVKMKPSNWNWYGDNPDDGKFAYFYNSTNGTAKWSKEAIGVPYCSDVLQITVPEGNWTHIILTRNSVHTNPEWSNVYNDKNDNEVNKSADIVIPDNQNYLDNFRQYKDRTSYAADMWHWSDNYFYKPSENPAFSSVTKIGNANREVINVCTQSVGDPFSLQPRLISESEGYDYNQGRTWFKWVDGKWIEIKQANHIWGFDGSNGLNETIGAVNSHAYYFLSTSDQKKQRFIEVAVTEDCSPTNEITDFGVVTSNVNAHDSTYVLDGIVAFQDALGGTLRISVTDAKGEHHVDYLNPTTPFIFSLPDLYADGTTGLVATATFIETGETYTSKPYNAPNAIMGIKTTTFNKTHGEATTLSPSTDGSEGFKWHDENTTDHERIIPSYNFDTTIIYTYYEYEKAPEVGGNLIYNGDFSVPEFNYGSTNYTTSLVGSNISDYNFWGKDVTSASDFYTIHGSISGGMAIVTDANRFWKRFTKKIVSKSGDHFALFDADNSGEKAAWKIETGTINPNLKLVKGTNYMFSFWVANINNYGEMNNAAKLQFEITYSTNDGATWSAPEKLGNPIDLNDYQDNLWHQNSHVYVAKEDADKVHISVKDLNNSSNPGGNDFALDDISFQAISVVSQAIKNCERFVVKIYEEPCTFSSIQIDTIRPKCSDTNKDKYSLRVTLKYDKPQGKLTLTDNIYGNIYEEATVSEATTKVITIDNLTADGKAHTLTAKFTKLDAHNVDKGCETVANFVAPGTPSMSLAATAVPIPSCNVTTFDLDVITTYAYQNGTQLLYYWDGTLHSEATKTITYGESTSSTSTLRSLPYDGKAHTLEVKTNHSTYDCVANIAIPAIPYMPSITVNEPQIQPYACGDATYSVKVSASFTNSQSHDIIFKDWKTGTEQHVTTTTDNGTAEYTFTYDWDDNPAVHEYNVYFEGANTCDHKKSYTAPTKPKIEITQYSFAPSTDCSKSTYDLTVTFDYYNQDGTLSVDFDGVTPSSAPTFVRNSAEKKSGTAVFSNLLADGGMSHKVTVKTTGGNHNCSVDTTLTNVPVLPVLNTVTQSAPAYSCGDIQYSDTLNITYTNAQGKDIVVMEGTTELTRRSGAADAGTHTIDIPLSFDFATDHTLTVSFDGRSECGQTVNIKSPVEPKATVTYKVLSGACGQTTYDLEVTLTYTNQDGSLNINVDGTAASTITPAFESNKEEEKTLTATIKNLLADGASHTLNVSFTGSNHACGPFNIPFDAPATPTIEPKNFNFSTPNCTDLYTTLTFDLAYTYQQGTLYYKVDNLPEQSKAISEKDKSQHSLLLTFENIPADGKPHTLSVRFDGPNSCDTTLTLPAAPLTQFITSVTVSGVPTTVLCSDLNYQAAITIETPYDANGKNFVIAYNGNDIIVAATGTTTTTTLTLTDIENPASKVTVAYEGSTCTPTGSTTDLVPPTRESCVKDEATICIGDSYHWNITDTDYTGSVVGIETITNPDNIHDTLLLTVVAKPVITLGTSALTCEDATEIRIPFSTTGDAPDTYDIDLSGNTTIENGDIVFTPSAPLAPGDYTATLTYSKAGLCENATTISFTIAIANRMYSKWTDVLFIDNGAHLYKAYQWYADGVAMPGETQQRLFDPNGLSGTNILYYCQLTTTDGQTLYTCPQTFDNTTPSRTVTNDTQTDSVRIYDTMGRPVAGNPTNGIYIIVEEREGEIFTSKILVND